MRLSSPTSFFVLINIGWSRSQESGGPTSCQELKQNYQSSSGFFCDESYKEIYYCADADLNDYCKLLTCSDSKCAYASDVEGYCVCGEDCGFDVQCTTPLGNNVTTQAACY
ncbi:unnamed protein product [Cercospora beticola]|nr:unnamed protein product [Cercospora beticola]